MYFCWQHYCQGFGSPFQQCILESQAITSPTPRYVARLPTPFVIEVRGSDAAKVINNLSTNDILKLPLDADQETFITDVRGWVVAHAAALKRQDSVWLIGSHASSNKICEHIDRYIIREEASIVDHTTTHALLVVGDGPFQGHSASANSRDANRCVSGVQADSAGPLLLGCNLPVLGQGSIVFCCSRDRIEEAEQVFVVAGSQLCSDQLFQWLRISSFWPLYPNDISEKTIPQELDRDPRAISFTKGCYLGQETIARLDARGQLQKKLCLLEIVNSDLEQPLQACDRLIVGDKEVGQITSIACDSDNVTWRALALLRRGNFTAGTEFPCNGQTARVLPIVS